ncbi:biotin-dependent carboxyltransferase family protein [Mesobacillus zeae]|uniref:Biotin-dependent carboxyltransferase n=1 Tax=Mesobacillus zeae TaxID=1917180 RepID=A0A398AXW4_9BACI|nr:biotin-dependent carboxyltransferase family protein [Mesobacillus zeae]RID82482.1 biotin-dependent carboxyltransferase [Mesobacillus zeae]
MSMEVIHPGLLTSIQDFGRFGNQKYGVIVNGAMDTLSHRVANLLVGNAEKMGTIEMNMQGAAFRFHSDAFIAITGAEMNATIDGAPVPMWRPIFVYKDAELKFGFSQKGNRTYISVAGGFNIPKEMGSESTYLLAEIGGYKGRKLQEGDFLSFRKSVPAPDSMNPKHSPHFTAADWSVSSEYHPVLRMDEPIRVIRGKEFGWFDSHSQQAFFQESFNITPQSDRMGYRLDGHLLSLQNPAELISEAVTFGTIQVPAEGNPIILMADRQTTGGYPKIGQVISVDLPVLAQKKPGETIMFREVSHAEAEKQYILREKAVLQLKRGLAMFHQLDHHPID